MPEHTHTDVCAEMSRYCLIQVRVVVSATGRADIRVSMKPSAACWTALDEVSHIRLDGEFPRPSSPEMAAQIAVLALEEAFPTFE